MSSKVVWLFLRSNTATPAGEQSQISLRLSITAWEVAVDTVMALVPFVSASQPLITLKLLG